MSKYEIISKLLTLMDSDVRARLDAQPGFQDALASSNLAAIWQMTENVCIGRGTSTVYHVAIKLWDMKQDTPESFPAYLNDWRETVRQLRSFGTAEQILEAMRNTKFAVSVHQKYFKEILTRVYALDNWPAYEDLAAQLSTYQINTEKMKRLEIKESAFVGVEDGCFNCGGDHLAKDCKRPKHKCEECGKYGHLPKYCELISELRAKRPEPSDEKGGGRKTRRPPGAARAGRDEENDRAKKRSPVKKDPKRRHEDKRSARKGPQKKSAGSFGRKIRSYVAEDDDEEYDDEEYSHDETSEQEELDHGYDDDDVPDDIDRDEADMVGTTDVDVEEVDESETAVSEEQAVALTSRADAASDPRPENTIFICDTGCRKWHITTNKSMLDDLRPVKARVTGINGPEFSIVATVKGRLPFIGDALYLPAADANLISVRRVLQMLGATCTMNEDRLVIHDADGEEILVGIANRGGAGQGRYDGFYTCTGRDLIRAAKRYHQKYHRVFPVGGDADKDDDRPRREEALPSTPPLAPQQPPLATHEGVRHFSPEERQRAREAWNLCALLGHPGMEKIARDLDNGAHPECMLTSHDVRNAIALFGPCTACVEGKMNNPSEPASTTLPAQLIGEHLHADLIPLGKPSIGGHTQMIAAVDEKSAYNCLVPTLNKSAPTLWEGMEQILAFFQQYGHKVVQITTDAESTLRALKTPLNQRGIVLTVTPAGLHEKRIERYIQTLKKRRAAILAGLDYELPHALVVESYMAAAASLNNSSCKQSAPYTPHHLVTGRKSLIPRFSFGQVGIFKGVNKEQPTEWGIFISHGDAPGSLRAYFPLRRGIQLRRKFIPSPNTVPKEWGLEPRIRKKAAGDRAATAPRGVNQPMGTTPLALPAPSAPIPPVRDDDDVLPEIVTEPPRITDHPVPHQASDTMTRRPIDERATAILRRLLDASTATGPAHAPSAIQAQPPRRVHFAEPPPRAPPQPIDATADSTRKSPSKGVLPSRAEELPSSPPTPASSRPLRAAAQHKGWVHGRPTQDYVALAERVFATAAAWENERLLSIPVYRISFGAALKMTDRRAAIEAAIHAEIHNMMRMKVVKPIKPSRVNATIRRRMIPAHMFLKFKYKADGSFDKVKARLVANGNMQDPDTIGETFAPTVNPITVKIVLQITATDAMFLSAYDIKGAFLLAEMEDGEVLYIRVPANVCKFWVELYPHLAAYLDASGSLVFELERYIYGLAKSPNRFNSLYDSVMTKKLGFKRLRSDRCVYVRFFAEQGPIIVCVHVDDMLVSCKTLQQQAWFEKAISKHFELVAQRGSNLSYLGMNILYDRKARTIALKQDGMIKELLKKYHCEHISRPPKSPALASLLKDPATIPGNKLVNKKDFLSLIMTLMYIARFTRHEILFAVVTLATRSACPRMSDMSHAMHIVRFLSGRRDIFPVFDGTKKIKPAIAADSSHNIHPSGHGHGGIDIVAAEGSAPVHVQSFKLKQITRASCESELVVCEEASTYAMWLKHILSELGKWKDAPITIYQDNKSTIHIATHGLSNFRRVKHLLAKESFLKERIENGDIVVEYLRSRKMHADFLTKVQSMAHIAVHLRALNMLR